MTKNGKKLNLKSHSRAQQYLPKQFFSETNFISTNLHVLLCASVILPRAVVELSKF